jgi:hypothetical protein
MDSNLTIDTLTFKQSFSDREGSERREISRGVNLPTVMTIKKQNYTDSTTKKAGVRTVLRFDRYLALEDGSIAPVSAYLVVATPTDTGVVSSDVLAVVQHIASTIQEDDSGLDLPEEIFVNGEQ